MDASHRLATVILNDSVAAEDALHDAYLTAWRAWPSLRDPSRLEAWFRRILVNTCRDRLRRASRWHIHDISDELAIAAQDPILPIDDRLVVEQALARLRPEDRILLALRFHGDLAIADIGQALGIRNGAVASRLHRALERLRKILVDSDSKEPGR